MFGIRRLRVLKVLLTALILICFCAVSFIIPEKSYAASLDIHTFPSEDNLPTIKTRNALEFSDDTLSSYKWTGVNGKKVFRQVGVSATSASVFEVPVNGRTQYTDFLDLYFTNVGTSFDGRKLNARVHFDSLLSTNYRTYRPSKIAVCYLSGSTQRLGISAEKTNLKVTFTTTVTYADTGEVFDEHMLQTISDMDIVSTYEPAYNESWTLGEGFTGDLWIWDKNNLNIKGTKLTATAGEDLVGNDSWIIAGCVAPTNNGKMTDTVMLTGTAASLYQLSIANEPLPAPVKSSNAKDINEEGDTIKYTVTQKMGEFYGNTMYAYDSFEIKDRIPDELEYVSAKAYNGNAAITSSVGNLSYNRSTKTVSLKLSDAFLSKPDNSYKGQTIKIEITAKVKKPTVSMGNIKNTAQTVIDGKSISSNTTTDVYAIPYGVSYKYVSGTDGRNLPADISTGKGDFKISDTATYYKGDIVKRKTSPADGTKYKEYDTEGNYKGVWTLTWNKASETVSNSDIVFIGTWVYTPAPRINIVKVLDNDADLFTEAHGEPSFLFKVTGDSGKVWYKSIRFSDEALEAVRGNGEYTDDTGTQFTNRDGKIYAMAASIYLPEDDYTVEEVETSRFEAEKAEARYHGDKTELIAQGKDSVRVPLKLSEYREGDPGYLADYASILFDNSKNKWNSLSHFDTEINKLGKGA